MSIGANCPPWAGIAQSETHYLITASATEAVLTFGACNRLISINDFPLDQARVEHLP